MPRKATKKVPRKKSRKVSPVPAAPSALVVEEVDLFIEEPTDEDLIAMDIDRGGVNAEFFSDDDEDGIIFELDGDFEDFEDDEI